MRGPSAGPRGDSVCCGPGRARRRAKPAGPRLNRRPCGGTFLGRFDTGTWNPNAKEEP
jgi:hypothetical protein